MLRLQNSCPTVATGSLLLNEMHPGYPAAFASLIMCPKLMPGLKGYRNPPMPANQLEIDPSVSLQLIVPLLNGSAQPRCTDSVITYVYSRYSLVGLLVGNVAPRAQE